MKTSPLLRHIGGSLTPFGLGALGFLISPIASADVFNKADNADALNLDSSWVEAGQPGSGDTASFGSVAKTADIGADLTWDGVSGLNNKVHTIEDAAGDKTLTLGAGGIAGNLAAPWQLNLYPAVVLAASQSWKGGRIHDSLDTQGFDWTINGSLVVIEDTAPILGGGNLLIVQSTFTLGGNRTHTGSTTVDGGLLYLNHENALGDSTTRSLKLKDGGTVGPDDDLSLAGANPTPITLENGGRVLFDGTTSDGASQTLSINSDISGTGGLIVDVGNLRNNQRHVADVTFGGSNSYAGATTLRTTGFPSNVTPGYHRLVVRNGLADALPTTTVITFDNREGKSPATQPISYDLNGFDQTVAGLEERVEQQLIEEELVDVVTNFDPEANAIVNSSGTGSVLTVNNSDDFTYNGWLGNDNYAGSEPFSATGNNFSLTKSGAGTLTLTADHSYTGATTVSEGTLALIGGSQDSPITVQSGAALGLDIAAPTSTSGSLTLDAGHGITILGTVNNSSDYLLMTAASITGTPALSPAVPGYTLEPQNSGTELWLVYSGGGSPTPYADWASANSVTEGFGGNDDGGSTSNGFEWYYFGSDPQVVDGNGSPLTGATKTGANTFQFTHQRPLVRDDVTEAYEWSADLGAWHADAAEDGGITVSFNAVGDAGDPYETVTVTATISGGTLDQLFVRQELTGP